MKLLNEEEIRKARKKRFNELILQTKLISWALGSTDWREDAQSDIQKLESFIEKELKNQEKEINE